MTELVIHNDPLPYANSLDIREVGAIDLLVIHCTELPDLATARAFGERTVYGKSQTGNSGHFYLERSGLIQQWVPLDRVAHHVHGYNKRSVGIELVNLGRYPDWFDSSRQLMNEPYPESQIASLVALAHHLKTCLPSLRYVAGHEALDTRRIAASDNPGKMVFRKRDPGPLFPWPLLLQETQLEMLEALSG